jgi:hypothetical protein
MTLKKYNQCSYFWCGLPKPLEHLFTVDQFPTWRSHQVWAHHDGSELISILSQRFASNTVFLSPDGDGDFHTVFPICTSKPDSDKPEKF